VEVLNYFFANVANNIHSQINSETHGKSNWMELNSKCFISDPIFINPVEPIEIINCINS